MIFLQPYLELFTDFIMRYYSEEMETANSLLEVTDISMPHEWYPEARLMAPRRIIYHMGPTNSGKTREAI